MSDKNLFAAQYSGRLIACLILLLLSTSLIEQTHDDHCEHVVCAVCSVSLSSLLPAIEHITAISLKTAGIVRSETTISARKPFSRAYDGRGPPPIS